MLSAGGAFEGVEDQVSPFGYGRGEGVDAGHGDPEWICSKEKPHYDQLFHSLNPIDGKVTGAGMQSLPYTPPPNHHNALPALLSAAHGFSQLTEICANFSQRGDEQNFTKILPVLSLTAQNCNILSQYMLCEPSHTSSGRISSAVSIHSLNDSAEEAVDEANVSVDNASNKSENADDDSHSESSSNVDEILKQNLVVTKQSPSFLHRIFGTIKFTFLLVLNLLTLLVTAECMFLAFVYIATGKPYLEINVTKSPQSLLDFAKASVFGPQEELVQITFIFQLFYRHNILNILKLLTYNIEYDGW